MGLPGGPPTADSLICIYGSEIFSGGKPRFGSALETYTHRLRVAALVAGP